MSLVLFQSEKVRKALAAPASVGIEVFVLAGVAAAIGGIVLLASHAAQPMREVVEIDLSAWALPRYTLLTLLRGCAAYTLSLGFTLVYGWIAAHNRRAERVMVPALDVLQAIPVLGFLPGLVLALVHIFPHREIGLELSCVIMIFTAQAWNMTFSFFGSLRGIPSTLREAAALQRLGGFQVFRILEVPASMIGLVWNSMMSMAGGWFFITVNEAFTLRDRDYRLPGLGSYMNEAINQGNVRAEVSAVVAMVVMIVVVDQVIWRPIVVWSERYKLEDTQSADQPKSWVMELFRRSRIVKLVRRLALAWRRRRTPTTDGPTGTLPPTPRPSTGPALAYRVERRASRWLRVGLPIIKWALLAALAVGAVWGCVILAKLLVALPVRQADHQDWLHVVLALLASLGRTMLAVVLGGLWALPAGILIGLSPRWSQRLQPIVQVVASFPAPMLFPLVAAALVLLHVPFTIGCVALMLLGTQWYVLFNVIAGAMAIPSDLREAARVYRLNRFTVWRELYIPAVFPYLVTGLVTAAGGAWNATIVSEYLQTKADTFVAFGLGSTITEATNAGNFPLLAASIVTMAVFVVAINRLLWRRLYRIAEARFSLNL